MAKSKNSDYNYLHANSRIWEMERRLLKADTLDRMIDYTSNEEMSKTLGEYGYEVGVLGSPSGALEEAIAQNRAKIFDELGAMAPDRRLIDIFRVKYDYHNIKAVLKGSLSGDDAERVMVDFGRFPARAAREALIRESQGVLSDAAFDGANDAREVLAKTGDAQLADIALDRAMYSEMAGLALEAGSAFLGGYVRLIIDAANLRTLVRSVMMGKDVEFVRAGLIAGGNIDGEAIVSIGDITGPLVGGLYSFTPLEAAAAEGLSAIKEKSLLTRFEKLCDDALTGYLRGAHTHSFGEAPLIAFIAAKEAETVAIRTIVSGRLAGVPGDEIRERVRSTYV